MSSTYTPSAATLTAALTITEPSDGDALAASSVNTALSKLADYTETLRSGVVIGGKTLAALHIDGTGGATSSAAAGQMAYSSGGVLHGYTLQGDLQTTNNSILAIASFTVPSNKAISLLAHVVGLKSDFSTGGSYFAKGMFKNAGGVVTPIGGGGGTTVISADEDDATWGGLAFTNAGAIISVTVQGKAATTINWSAIVHITIV